MGLLDLIKLNEWTLVAADPVIVLALTGQYQPENGTSESADPTVSATSTTGSAAPTVQWVAGGARVVRFQSVFRSRHFLEDIRWKRDALRQFRDQSPLLGRAPLVTFTWGDQSITGFMTVLRDSTDGLWATGLPRQVNFEIEIMEVRDAAVRTGAPPTGETQYVVLGAGETFEALGYRYAADPMKGELIRRGNPDLALGEAAGDRVKVLEREHPDMRVAVYPTSPPFLDRARTEETWQPVVEALAAERGTSESPGTPWLLLAEVAAGEV